MPNPYAKIPLTYDATDLQRADWSVYLELVEGLDEVPRVRGDDTIIPGKPGRRARGRMADILPLSLAGYIQGVGDADVDRLSSFRTVVNEMRTLFDPTRAPAYLGAELEDGSIGSILARPLALVWGPEEIPGVRRLVVSLESVVPDWSRGIGPAPVAVVLAVPEATIVRGLTLEPTPVATTLAVPVPTVTVA